MGHWRHAVLLCLWAGECWLGWTKRNDRCRPFLCVLKESDLKEVIWLRDSGGKRGFSVFLLSPGTADISMGGVDGGITTSLSFCPLRPFIHSHSSSFIHSTNYR